MSHDGAYDVKKDVRRYIAVFVSLACLTVATVAVSYIESGAQLGVIIALIIATVKAALVACCFMHLISEEKLIYAVLALVVVLFIALLFLPVLGFYGAFTGIEFK